MEVWSKYFAHVTAESNSCTNCNTFDRIINADSDLDMYSEWSNAWAMSLADWRCWLVKYTTPMSCALVLLCHKKMFTLQHVLPHPLQQPPESKCIVQCSTDLQKRIARHLMSFASENPYGSSGQKGNKRQACLHNVYPYMSVSIPKLTACKFGATIGGLDIPPSFLDQFTWFFL